MPLIPCKFYAQGNCRYGDQCKFYHEPRGQTGMFGNRLAPATFQPGGGYNQGAALNLATKSNQNLDIIVEGVKKDMQEWQASKIWPYSCYGPVGGKSCVPGFEDVSPEELRIAYMQQGSMPPEMHQRTMQIQQLRMNYQQPTLENRSIIERIVTSSVSGAQSPFGAQTAPVQSQAGSIFGGASTQTTQPAASIFGGASNQQSTGSIFGGGSVFGGQSAAVQPATSSIFGGSSTFGQVASAPASTFGQPSTLGSSLFQTQTQPAQSTGIFGAQAGQGSVFGGTPSQQQSTNLFQTAQQPQQTGIFQSQPQATTQGNLFQQPNTQGGVFQQQPNQLNPAASQGGLFQPPQQQPPTGLFQIPTSQPIQQTQTPSIFGQQQQPSLLGPASGSIFGGGIASQQQPVASAPSIFGGTAAAPSFSVAGNAPQPGLVTQIPPVASTQKFVYSEESDLTPEELEAFKATDFTLDSLPTKLPPRALCI